MRREIAFWVGLALLVVLCIGLALSGRWLPRPPSASQLPQGHNAEDVPDA